MALDGEVRTEEVPVVPTVQTRLTEGRRSSTAAGTAVLADAARVVDPILAAHVTGETRWRQAYAGHVRDLLVASVKSPAGSVAVARAGLDAARRAYVMAGPDGERDVDEAVRAAPAQRLGTAVVEGAGEREKELVVPYRGERLRGDALRRVVDHWQERGVVEPSHADALRRVMDEPERLDLGDRMVALLGAGAQMSPYAALCRWGAHVVAVDLPRPELWRRVLDVARAGCGRVVVPVRAELADEWTGPDGLAEGAGADLLTETAAVRELLERQERPLVVGNHVYAPGSVFARLAVAADAVTTAVLASRPESATAVLATPTDVYAVPPSVVVAARERFAGRGALGVVQGPLRVLSGGRVFQASYGATVRVPDGRELGVADCLVEQQGPNYALAKTLQRWRALVAFADGVPVSVNVAPPTATRSVLSNRLLAAAYAGTSRFGVETFAPDTASTVMAALLVDDLQSPPPELAHPHDLFSRGANHGGLWRIGYEPRSVLHAAVAFGAPQLLRP